MLHISNDRSIYDADTRRLFDEMVIIEKTATYDQKLTFSVENSICITEICSSDISGLIEQSNNVTVISGAAAPQLTTIFNLVPDNTVEVLQLNLKNISTVLSHADSFSKYQEEILAYLDQHRESIFLIEWIEKQIKEAERKCSKFDYFDFAKSPSGVKYWYNAFDGKKESLMLSDYKIWLTEVDKPMLYRNRPFNSTIPKMCYLIDDPEDIINAAKGFFYTQIIPFLKAMKEIYVNNLYPELLSPPQLTLPANEQPETTESQKTKGRKKEKLTHKQQMVLAGYFDLISHSLIVNLTPKQRGNILGALLNHGVDDTRNMLHPETSKTDPRLDWNTEYERGVVKQFLLNNGVDLDDL